MASQLPSFEEIRRRAHAQLGDVLDELRSDWREPSPTIAQARHLNDARSLIATAKSHLDAAALRR